MGAEASATEARRRGMPHEEAPRWRKDGPIWAGLACLLLGLLLMDRSFAAWRNGSLNPLHAGMQTAQKDSTTSRTRLLSGFGVGLLLFGCSCALLRGISADYESNA